MTIIASGRPAATNAAPAAAPDRGRAFGPAFLRLRIAEGVSAGNFAALLFGSFFGIAMMGFINASQPYLFTEVLKVPAAEQGPLAGNLTFLAELVAMLAVGFVGALSDKVGRRPLWAGAFVVLALGYALYPLATTVEELTAYRVVFALGLAANTAMLPAVANDYAVDESRGKVIAICFMLNGLGFILLLTPLRLLLPVFSALTDGDPVMTARYWLWSAAGACLLVSAVLQLGLRPGAPAQLAGREPWLLALKVGIRAGRDLRVAFAYLSATVARGDMSVLSTFFVLYLTQAGLGAGLDTEAASNNALKFYILIQVFALCWLPVMGRILDRMDRVVGVAVALALATGGYASLYLIGDPMGPLMWLSAVLIGMGEISANLATLTLIGSVAPVKGRGAVIGLFSLSGAIGILLVAKVGGILSGMFGGIAPFVLVAGANAFVMLLGLAVWAASRRPAAVPVVAAGPAEVG
ncbi:MAG: MFS transporter [Chromatiales bacterium]|jgi:MFS family permease|nr:MFS transporter [Chromatiales bacterium]